MTSSFPLRIQQYSSRVRQDSCQIAFPEGCRQSAAGEQVGRIGRPRRGHTPPGISGQSEEGSEESQLVRAAAAATCGRAAPSGPAAARRFDVLRDLLTSRQRLGATLVLGAGAGKEIAHRVVPLVTRVLVEAVS